MLRRRRAWREPGVLNRVAHHVPGEAAPGGCEMPVTPWRQRDGRHCVPDARPGAGSARSNVAGILAPECTQTRLDRVRDAAAGGAVSVAAAGTPRILPPVPPPPRRRPPYTIAHC